MKAQTYTTRLDVSGSFVARIKRPDCDPQTPDDHEYSHDKVEHEIEASLGKNTGRSKRDQRGNQHQRHRKPIGKTDQQQVSITVVEVTSVMVNLQDRHYKCQKCKDLRIYGLDRKRTGLQVLTRMRNLSKPSLEERYPVLMTRTEARVVEVVVVWRTCTVAVGILDRSTKAAKKAVDANILRMESVSERIGWHSIHCGTVCVLHQKWDSWCAYRYWRRLVNRVCPEPIQC